MNSAKPKSKNQSSLIIISIIAAVLGLAIGAYMFLKPQSLTTSGKADFEVTAAELSHAFSSNPDSSMLLFNNKIILVSGKITRIDSDSSSGINNVVLDAGPEAPADVKGEFAAESSKDVENIKSGDNVRFKGTVSHQDELMGIPGDIIIKHASIVK